PSPASQGLLALVRSSRPKPAKDGRGKVRRGRFEATPTVAVERSDRATSELTDAPRRRRAARPGRPHSRSRRAVGGERRDRGARGGGGGAGRHGEPWIVPAAG